MRSRLLSEFGRASEWEMTCRSVIEENLKASERKHVAEFIICQ